MCLLLNLKERRKKSNINDRNKINYIPFTILLQKCSTFPFIYFDETVVMINSLWIFQQCQPNKEDHFIKNFSISNVVTNFFFFFTRFSYCWGTDKKKGMLFKRHKTDVSIYYLLRKLDKAYILLYIFNIFLFFFSFIIIILE